MFKIADYMGPKELEEFCRKYHVRKLSLFGSALNGDLKAQSDIDLLVEFEPQCTPGLLTLAEMEIKLADTFGRKVDLKTPSELSPYFRQSVLNDSKLEYVAEG
ncbi:MAG: nucleotidyltransferase family protein [Chitinispirillaceae bacterium]